MAHLWFRETVPGGAPQVVTETWSPLQLDGDGLGFGAARILHRATPEGDAWVLLGPPSVVVNGMPLDTGIRVLQDRDELRSGDVRTFFSSEALAAVAPFIPGPTTACCPRCKLEIVAGSAAVRCPGCKIAHHQTEDLPCWEYAPRCALCDQPTALEAGFRWTPDGI